MRCCPLTQCDRYGIRPVLFQHGDNGMVSLHYISRTTILCSLLVLVRSPCIAVKVAKEFLPATLGVRPSLFGGYLRSILSSDLCSVVTDVTTKCMEQCNPFEIWTGFG